ncbi:MAG: MFS transporter [Desulfosarcinaceae bacterium]|nr:MFS transporter [Desulfosarcinaceae bacterium]
MLFADHHRHRADRSLATSLGAAIFCRFILNTARRFAYPFAPVLSRGLGVPLTAVTSLIAVNQFSAVLGAACGPLADRWGYRTLMVIGLGLLGSGMLAAACLPFYAVVMAALLLAGFGKTLFDPALQGFIGERVPFERRGLVVGLVETSWAASTLVGMPCIALLIEHFGWRAPFLVIGIAGGVGAILIWMLLPPSGRRSDKPDGVQGDNLFRALQGLFQDRSALAFMAYAFLVSLANDVIFVTYSTWLEGRFALGVVALGLGTSIIGAAELGGEGLTALFADRIGLRRAVLLGGIFSVLSYLLLPLCGSRLGVALGGLFFVFISFEFTLVTSLSLCTEILPTQRATMVAGFFAAAGLGRVLGAFLGGYLWGWGGMQAAGAAAGGCAALGIGCICLGLRSWRPE